MDIRPSYLWGAQDRQDMAGLIVDPATNGNVESELTAEQVAAAMPEKIPAWGVWEEDRPVFLVILTPFDGVGGCLHIAGTRTLTHAQHVTVVRAFLGCFLDVVVFTVTTNPAMVRLARQVGLVPTGEVDGTYTLERKSPHQAGINGTIGLGVKGT